MSKDYKILRKTGRLANGNEGGAGTIYHAVKSDGISLCGTTHGRLGNWGFEEGEQVTCSRCLKKMEKSEERVSFYTEYLREHKLRAKLENVIVPNLEEENLSLKLRWEKLKEFIKKEIAFDKDEVKDFPLAPNRHYITAESMILDKMQELEKESKDEV